MKYPVVSIIGRPNVGKSSLLNKILGQRKAIVDDRPGVTRDRLYVVANWLDRFFTLIDTGGIFLDKKFESASNFFQQEIEIQVQIAIEESDLILFMVNVEEGVTPFDRYIAKELSKQKKPVIIVVNKVENTKRQLESTEFYELGIENLQMVSALHGNGVGDLLDVIVDQIPKVDVDEDNEGVIPVAIIGKPNVGKSSIFNKILGEKRSIVSDVAGTTRDIIDERIKREGHEFRIVDTAGIRRKSKIIDKVENYSVIRSVQAVSKADVAILVIDATQPISDQDKKIAGIIEEETKGCVILVNKWDLVDKDSTTILEYERYVKEQFKFLGNAPVLFVSALTGQRLSRVFQTVINVYNEYHKRISTADLNNVINKAILHKPPPSYKKKRLKVNYVTQPKTAPPVFLFFVNNPDLVHFSYKRYIENTIRQEFGFDGVQMLISFRKK